MLKYRFLLAYALVFTVLSIFFAGFTLKRYNAETIVITKRVFESCNATLARGELDYNSITPYSVRRKRMEDLARNRPYRTISEILALPSAYTPGNSEFKVTAVVSMYRRKGHVSRWLNALATQTHPPAEIWFTFFASPHSDELRKEVMEARDQYNQGKSNPIPIRMVQGEVQYRYWGRFQLALQVPTKYVAIFDDDSIPGSKYLETVLYTMHTQDYGRGILGIKGTSWRNGDIYYGPMSDRPDHKERIYEVDVVGGSWFMQAEWVKLMFREKIHSWLSAEDFTLCAAARKYADARCFVMPIPPAEPERWGFSHDYVQISFSGDTTGHVPGTNEARVAVVAAQWQRGERRMDTLAAHPLPGIMLFAETHSDAVLLIDLAQHAYSESDALIHLATSGNGDVQPPAGKSWGYRVRTYFNHAVGTDYMVPSRECVNFADTAYHFDMALQGTLSTALMVIGSNPTPATLSAVFTAQLRGLTIININIATQSDKQKQQTSNAIASLATVTFDLQDTDSASIRASAEYTKIQKVLQEVIRK